MSQTHDEELARTQLQMNGLVPHHFGCLVRNLDEAMACYGALFPVISPKIYVSAQKVTVCFVQFADSISLELIEPAEPSAATQTMLKRGIAYYHVGYLAKEYDQRILELEALGFSVVESFRSEAFEGRRCAFLMTPLLHLIELIEV